METFEINTHIWVDIAFGTSLGYLNMEVRGKRSPFKVTIGSRRNQITDKTITKANTTCKTTLTVLLMAKLLFNLACELSFSSPSSLLILLCNFEYTANSSFIDIFCCSAFSLTNSDNIFRSSFEGLAKHAAIWKKYKKIKILIFLVKSVY